MEGTAFIKDKNDAEKKNKNEYPYPDMLIFTFNKIIYGTPLFVIFIQKRLYQINRNREQYGRALFSGDFC